MIKSWWRWDIENAVQHGLIRFYASSAQKENLTCWRSFKPLPCRLRRVICYSTQRTEVGVESLLLPSGKNDQSAEVHKYPWEVRCTLRRPLCFNIMYALLGQTFWRLLWHIIRLSRKRGDLIFLSWVSSVVVLTRASGAWLQMMHIKIWRLPNALEL